MIVILLSSAADMRPQREWPNLGLTTWLTKPIRQSQLLQVLQHCASDVRIAGPVVTDGIAKQAALGLKVLLAEDNEVNAMVAAGLLEQIGCHVDVVTNGRDVIAMSLQGHYDVVLMDVQMPIMDGLEATRKVRERERTTGEHLRIIAMTASAMEGDRESCIAAGMDDYISKPINATAFRDTMKSLATLK
jgi:CheY-like chemotaxis protein